MRIFGSVVPQSESTFPFFYIIIWVSFEAPSCTLEGDRHMRSRPFRTKFNSEQHLFEPFFDAMRIFGSIEPQNESTFPFFLHYNI